MIVFQFDDGFSVGIARSTDEPNSQIVLSAGSFCKVVARSRFNKKLKRQGETCVLTGKYRTYNTDTYYKSSVVAAQIRFTSDNFCQWISLIHL